MTWYQHCDGPGCNGHARGEMLRGWIAVRERGELHFCCWDCLLKFAGKVEPPTSIGFGGAVA